MREPVHEFFKLYYLSESKRESQKNRKYLFECNNTVKITVKIGHGTRGLDIFFWVYCNFFCDYSKLFIIINHWAEHLGKGIFRFHCWYKLRRYEIIGPWCMGTCHPMATLEYIDSATSFPQLICYKVVLKVSAEYQFPQYINHKQAVSCI